MRNTKFRMKWLRNGRGEIGKAAKARALLGGRFMDTHAELTEFVL